MATFYIHAGYGKCGSTAIQRWLQNAGASLRKDGAFNCGTGLQHCPEAPFGTVPEMIRAIRTDPDAAARDIGAALAAAGERHSIVIWSCEALQLRHRLLAPIIAELMTRHEVKVVLYLRNHVAWLLSAYAQWGIKHPTSRHKTAPHAVSFAEFVESRRPDLDYAGTIAGWERTGATVLPRSYDAAADVVDDFIALAGLSGSSDGGRANPPMQPTTLALLKGIQSVRKAPVGIASFEKMLRRSALSPGAIETTSLDLLPEADVDLAALHASFQGERDALRARYGLDLTDTAPRNPLTRPSGTNDDVVAVLSLICQTLHERVETLEARLATLEAERKPAPTTDD